MPADDIRKTPLWSWTALAAVTGATADGEPSQTISGVSIDTRSLQPGDVFVALKDVRDGHEFVGAAFRAGAAAAIVSHGYRKLPDDRALLRVEDPLRALEDAGRVARFRSDAKVVAVTGSVGKTGTKEMLRLCLAAYGATHASEKSYNNHWGVPLTLARMPSETQFAIFEIGMNHAGEITPLTRMVAPDIAIITTVEPVHLGHFPSVEAIADAKAEILLGVRRGGIAVLNRDNRYFERLRAEARRLELTVLSFGTHVEADVRAVSIRPDAEGTEVEIECPAGTVKYRVGIPGLHVAQNSLAVAAVLSRFGLDLKAALEPLAALAAPEGRGARQTITSAKGRILLIDESYNANPASMRAALAVLATVPRSNWPRRLAVLGDMRELGAEADRLHRELAEAVASSGADRVFLCGPHMQSLDEVLPTETRGGSALNSLELVPLLKSSLSAGDVVMIKGSLGTNMAPLVKTVRDWAVS